MFKLGTALLFFAWDMPGVGCLPKPDDRVSLTLQQTSKAYLGPGKVTPGSQQRFEIVHPLTRPRVALCVFLRASVFLIFFGGWGVGP